MITLNERQITMRRKSPRKKMKFEGFTKPRRWANSYKGIGKRAQTTATTERSIQSSEYFNRSLSWATRCTTYAKNATAAVTTSIWRIASIPLDPVHDGWFWKTGWSKWRESPWSYNKGWRDRLSKTCLPSVRAWRLARLSQWAPLLTHIR